MDQKALAAGVYCNMKYEEMLKIADRENLTVRECDLWQYDGLIKNRTIAIRKTLPSRKAKSCVLAEEIGHARTSSGNIIDYSDPNDQKQELKARMEGYDLLIGLDGIIKAYEAGCRNQYEIAEFLDVTEEFLIDALESYREKYGTYVTRGRYCIMFEPSLAVMKRL